MVNNADWLDTLGYVDLLRDVGPHFTDQPHADVRFGQAAARPRAAADLLEFNYMILQAYDFRHLSQQLACRLQLGGSDQWGNIVNGVELTRRMDGVEVFGVTTPWLTTADGSKMGKTAQGAVWLNEAQLRATTSGNTGEYRRPDVGRFLRLFTDLPLDEIARYEALKGGEINEAKAVLANEVTKLVRGEDAAVPRTNGDPDVCSRRPRRTICRSWRSRAKDPARCRLTESASPPRTARPSARSPKARCGSTTRR
jgi:tyrosyl-tRNA synthetase